MTAREISYRIDRNVHTVRKRMSKLGMTKKSRSNWSKEEDDFLRENYGIMTAPEISKHINRNAPAIRKRAHKLGVKYQQTNWR